MTNWHVDESVANRYAAGTLSITAAASVEAHVIRCQQCKRVVGAGVPPPRLDAVWHEVISRIDAPRVSPIERLLGRLGMSESDSRLVMAAPALRLSWMLALLGVLLFSVLAAGAMGTGPNVFLLLAPVLPVVGVGVAYGPRSDPTYELAQATPYSSVRLLLLRTMTVLVVTAVPAAVVGVTLPAHSSAVVWLLPALGLVSATLALAARLPIAVAAAVTSTTWLAVMVGLWATYRSLDPAFGARGQIVALLVGAGAIVVVIRAHQLDAYETGRR